MSYEYDVDADPYDLDPNDEALFRDLLDDFDALLEKDDFDNDINGNMLSNSHDGSGVSKKYDILPNKPGNPNHTGKTANNGNNNYNNKFAV
eukprot:UN09363